MAKIKFTPTNQTEEIPNGEGLRDVCENKFNIPFGCKDGICGTCRIRISKGLENLSSKNEKETDLLPDNKNERLACQTNILKGQVEMDDGYD